MAEEFIKGIIRPTRRSFLTGAAAMAVASLLPKAADAFFMNAGGATVPALNPAQPAPAASYGFNTLTLYDDFNSLSTIDVNNTLAPGYKWYVSNVSLDFGQIVTPASALSISNSILTIDNTVNLNGIANLGFTGSSEPYGLVGNSIAATGGYFQCRFSYNPALQTSPSFPAWYIWDAGLATGLVNGSSFPSSGYAELDLMEAYGGPPPTLDFAMHQWNSSSTVYNNTNNNGTPVVGNDGNFHVYGTLWVPQSKNGGTGLIKRYVDGSLYSANTVTYSSTTVSPEAQSGSPTGWMSCLDTSALGYLMSLNSAQNWPINIDYVQVWQ